MSYYNKQSYWDQLLNFRLDKKNQSNNDNELDKLFD